MLDCLLKVGDRVVHNSYPEEDTTLKRIRHEHGDVATITGFKEYYIGHGEGRPAGVYHDTAYADMLYKDGFTITINTRLYHLIDSEEYDRRLLKLLDLREAHPNDWATILMKQHFVHDLPKTKFWVGDIVTINNPPTDLPPTTDFIKECQRLSKQPIPPSWCDFNRAEVRKICYNRLDSVPYQLNCGYKPGLNHIIDQHCRPENRTLFPNGCMVFGFAEADLELDARGRFWKYYHNEPIAFLNLEDEIAFAKSVGNVTYADAPTMSYDDAMVVIRAKRAHGIECLREGNDLFGGEYRLATFKDPDLTRRVYDATLKDGFTFPA